MESIDSKFVFGSGAEAGLEILNRQPHPCESLAEGSKRKVRTVRGVGDFAEGGFVQAAVNCLTAIVPQQFELTLFVEDLDLLAARCPDAHGENDHALLRQLLGLGDSLF